MNRFLFISVLAAALPVNLSGQDLKTPEQFPGYTPGQRFTIQQTVNEYFRHVADKRHGDLHL